MKVSDILRKIADAVDVDAEQQSRNQASQAALHQQELEQAKLDSQDLTAGQVAQVVDAANRMQQAAELQRSASDMNAAIQAPSVNSHELTPADNTDATDDETMIGPLQQKHELLKKATDTSNDVDKFDDGMDDNKDDELLALKKMAGIDDPALAPAGKQNTTALIQLVSDEFDT